MGHKVTSIKNTIVHLQSPFQYRYFEQPGNVEERLTFTYGQIPYAATGTNASGIELTPDRKNLIVVV
ncbi:MAG TPA: hypothetical protein VEY06_10720 [Flavisolibacter sp.]|nr:hypothetical protein [Flavisolibacter sp.]